MSQVNDAVSRVQRRDWRRVLTALAVVAAMGAVSAFQLRHEATRSSATAPTSTTEQGPPTR